MHPCLSGQIAILYLMFRVLQVLRHHLLRVLLRRLYLLSVGPALTERQVSCLLRLRPRLLFQTLTTLLPSRSLKPDSILFSTPLNESQSSALSKHAARLAEKLVQIIQNAQGVERCGVPEIAGCAMEKDISVTQEQLLVKSSMNVSSLGFPIGVFPVQPSVLSYAYYVHIHILVCKSCFGKLDFSVRLWLNRDTLFFFQPLFRFP